MSSLDGKKVLVTGASGFLGTALVARLLEDKAEVYGVSRRDYDDEAENLHWIKADLSVESAAEEIIVEVRPDIVYHLAGFADGNRDLRLIEPTFEQNALMTVRLLTAVARHPCERFVYAASMEEPDPFDATALPNGPYSAGKWVATVYTRMFHRLYGAPCVVLRIYLTYGPGPQARTKLIPYAISTLLEGGSPRVSSGARLVDVVYIDDVVEGFIMAAECESAVGKVVEIGSGRRRSLREVVEAIVNEVGGEAKASFGAAPDRPDEMTPTADIERSYALLGWRPGVTFEEGIKRTVAWYRRQMQKA